LSRHAQKKERRHAAKARHKKRSVLREKKLHKYVAVSRWRVDPPARDISNREGSHFMYMPSEDSLKNFAVAATAIMIL
jgi:hypothetical protein